MVICLDDGHLPSMASPLGKRFRAARLKTMRIVPGTKKSKPLTQEQAGALAGLTGATVSRIERGEHVPETSTAKALADVYKVSASWLIEGDVPEAGAPAPTPIDRYLDRLRDELAAREGLDTEEKVRAAAFRVIAIEEAGGSMPGSKAVESLDDLAPAPTRPRR
jgi:transcriptional regulator with XRE-family HTH domain